MTSSVTDFEFSYKKLNKEQRQAVDTIEGPVMLVAGPGTGKTQTLALRIANIIKKTDTSASSILALTYTESGARAMKSRLIEMIGAEAYYTNISTFHAFCQGVIKENPDIFILNPTSEPLSELEKIKIIQSLIDKLKLKILRPTLSPYYYSGAVLGAISDLKREAVDPDEFDSLLNAEEAFLNSDDAQELKKPETLKRRRNLDKNRELNLLYREYQKILIQNKTYDFEDMINTVIEAFKHNEDLLLTYQEKYLYILVDEYQDSNNAQNELLVLLSKYWGQEANIFVTGDPDQSIMRFQGASIENQLSFINTYPNAKVITLKTNYRSTQEILDIADSLISQNHLRINNVVPGIDPHLISVKTKNSDTKSSGINLATLSTNVAELIFVAEDVKNKIQNGVSPREIAIIYHKNIEMFQIGAILAKYGIDYVVQGGTNLLFDPLITNFLKILKVIDSINRGGEDEDLFVILHFEIFNLDPLDILKISRLAGDSRKSIFEVISNKDILSTLNLASPSVIGEFVNKLISWSTLESQKTFIEFFEIVLNDSGYLSSILNSYHNIAKINTLFEEIKRMNNSQKNLNLRVFLENINIMQENKLRLEESSYGITKEAITLTTAHKSKGLEWEHVYIVKAIDGNWGNTKKRELISLPDTLLKNVKPSDKEKNEDERRLFYVAITRAKSFLTLTRAETYNYFGKPQPSSPTMFLQELKSTLVENIDVSHVEQNALKHIETILKRQVPYDSVESEKAYLLDLVANFKLAATSLNSYLHCAYKFKLDKLLKVPHAKKSHLLYGTSIHAALEKFYNKILTVNEIPDLEFLLSHFRHSLKNTVISDKDLEVYLEKGERVLTAYHKFHQHNISLPLATEKSLSANIGDIQITGKLDRLDWVDKESRLVRVVDYKTGKPKTLGQIKGDTQDSEGDLRRQLEFYKLLIDLDPTLNYKFGEGMFDFVEEPELNGKLGERRLIVTDAQVEELKSTIQVTMKNIRSLSFSRTTDLKKCENCYFKDHCYPNGLPTT